MLYDVSSSKHTIHDPESLLGSSASDHTYTTFESGIALDCSPNTYRDTIHTTRVLGIQYLWIDSLCIVQDSKKDWQKESLGLESVYSQSYCNIAATRSRDSRGGCFVDRPAWTCHPAILDITKMNIHNSTAQGSSQERGFGVFAESSDSLWVEEISCSALLQRAWVFQERFLSPRILHFARNQLFFECREVVLASFIQELFASRIQKVAQPSQMQRSRGSDGRHI
jgi:hypothetical protein